LAAAIVAAVILVFSRPVTRLTKIQIVLTVLVGIAFIAGMQMASWLHSMASADPVRQLWQPRLDVIGSVTWFGTLIPWFLFTVFHVAVVLKRKRTARDDL
jgi:amino acid transporter